eukprot:scaffold24558_cov37-Prasinocladus_malaysianus.AAC.2
MTLHSACFPALARNFIQGKQIHAGGGWASYRVPGPMNDHGRQKISRADIREAKHCPACTFRNTQTPLSVSTHTEITPGTVQSHHKKQ